MNIKRLVINSLKTGIPFGIGMSLFFALRFGVTLGLVVGFGSGVLFGVLLSAFLEYQRKRMEATGSTFEGENLVHQGPANHRLSGEARGGWLYLTHGRLCFRSHGTNIQNIPVNIPTSEISKAEAGWTFGLIPNLLKVTLKDGTIHKFVVSGHKTWAEKLGK